MYLGVFSVAGVFPKDRQEKDSEQEVAYHVHYYYESSAVEDQWYDTVGHRCQGCRDIKEISALKGCAVGRIGSVCGVSSIEEQRLVILF